MRAAIYLVIKSAISGHLDEKSAQDGHMPQALARDFLPLRRPMFTYSRDYFGRHIFSAYISIDFTPPVGYFFMRY